MSPRIGGTELITGPDSTGLMPALTAESLIKALDSSRLLAGDTIDRLSRTEHGGDSSPAEVLRPLIEKGEITRWQAEQLLAGGTTFDLGKYRLLEFIGRGGQVLKTDVSLEPSYELNREDLYVRAKVTSSNGSQAWTQPLFAPGKGRIE